jgi:hypothetical protein
MRDLSSPWARAFLGVTIVLIIYALLLHWLIGALSGAYA